MKLFSTVDDVKHVFLEESLGGDSIARDGLRGVRLSDIDTHSTKIQRLLESTVNKVNGLSFTEILEAVKKFNAIFGTNQYMTTAKSNCKELSESMVVGSGKEGSDFCAVSEDFAGTQVATAPYPVPSVGMSLYHYEQTVLPFLAHLYDLEGIRGFIYYQNIFAENAKGNVAKDNLLGSPKQIADVQPVGFVGTKKTNETVAKTVAGQTGYTGTLANVPVMPGTVTIFVPGKEGHFTDIANKGSRAEGTHQLLSVEGNLGTATINYKTGAITIELKDAPASGDINIVANYDREVQTAEDGAGNIAKVRMELESKVVVAEDFSVQTTANVQTEALARAVFGLDWNRELNRMLAQLFNKEVGNKVITEIKEALGTEQVAIHDMANGINNMGHTGDITALGGNNNLFNIWMLPFVVNKLNQIISENSGIQAQNVNTILVGQAVVPIIRGLDKFEDVKGTVRNQSGTALIGKYRGIPVLAGYAPIVNNNEILGLYKDPETDFLAPYAVGTFLAPFIRDIYDNANLAVGRKQLIASVAGTVCAERLVAKIDLTNIDKLL